MRRRIILAAACGVIVLLTATAAAFAAATRDTSKVYSSTPGVTWMVKLRGTLPGTKVREMTFRGFANFKATHRLEWTDTVSGDKYSGVDLKGLVGLIDDANPATFNTSLATGGDGYMVRIIGLDGFSYDFKSSDVASAGILVADKALAAGTAKELALVLGTAKAVTGPPESARWSPTWPLKLAGDFVNASGKMRIGGISIIQLIPTPAPAQ